MWAKDHGHLRVLFLLYSESFSGCVFIVFNTAQFMGDLRVLAFFGGAHTMFVNTNCLLSALIEVCVFVRKKKYREYLEDEYYHLDKSQQSG